LSGRARKKFFGKVFFRLRNRCAIVQIRASEESPHLVGIFVHRALPRTRQQKWARKYLTLCALAQASSTTEVHVVLSRD
jgi:hypothetical protein